MNIKEILTPSAECLKKEKAQILMILLLLSEPLGFRRTRQYHRQLYIAFWYLQLKTGNANSSICLPLKSNTQNHIPTHATASSTYRLHKPSKSLLCDPRFLERLWYLASLIKSSHLSSLLSPKLFVNPTFYRPHHFNMVHAQNNNLRTATQTLDIVVRTCRPHHSDVSSKHSFHLSAASLGARIAISLNSWRLTHPLHQSSQNHKIKNLSSKSQPRRLFTTRHSKKAQWSIASGDFHLVDAVKNVEPRKGILGI